MRRTHRLAKWAAPGRDLDVARLPVAAEVPGLAQLLGTSDEITDGPSLVTMPKTFLAYILAERAGLLVEAEGKVRTALDSDERLRDDLLLWDALVTELMSWLPQEFTAISVRHSVGRTLAACVSRGVLNLLADGSRTQLRRWLDDVLAPARAELERCRDDDDALYDVEETDLEGDVLVALAWLCDFGLLKLPVPLTPDDIVADTHAVRRLLAEDWVEPTGLGIWYARRHLLRATLTREQLVAFIDTILPQVGVERTAQILDPGSASSWPELLGSLVLSDHPRTGRVLAAFQLVADRAIAEEARRAAARWRAGRSDSGRNGRPRTPAVSAPRRAR